MNLFMSAEQIIAVAESKSLRCYVAKGTGASAHETGYCCSRKGMCRGFRNNYKGISFRFKSGTKNIKRIDISCNVTKSCGLEIRDIADILINKGIVQRLEYEVVPIIDVNLGRYRGRGPAGDELVINPIIQISVPGGGITLQLGRQISKQTDF